MSRSTRTGGREATKGVIPGRIALSVGKPDFAEPEGFQWRLLSDLARLESGHTPSRSKAEYWGGKIPWVGIRDATGNHGKVITKTLDYVTQEGLDNSSARLLPAGTVCLSRTASVGYVVEMGQPMATSQDFVNWACGPGINSHYLRYILVLEQESVRRFSHGTTHQTMYYPEAKALNVLIPERSHQDAIVEVLAAIDDKIAANDHLRDLLDDLNVNLTSRATRESTTSLRLKEVLRLHYGKALPAPQRRSGDVIVYGSGGATGTHNAALVTSPGIIIGRKGTVGAIYWADGPHFPIDTTYYVDPLPPLSSEILYYLLRTLHLNELNSDSAVPGLNRDEAYSQLVRLPNDPELLTAKLADQLSLSKAVRAESIRLATIRDELLPLLMSGKIRVRDAERLTGGVL